MKRVLNLMLGKGSGGLETVAFQYARVLKEAGCESVIVCHSRSAYRASSVVWAFTVFGASVLNPFNHIKVLAVIRRFRPDVVFCHGGRGAQFCTWFLRMLVSRQTKFIGVCHGANGRRFRRFGRIVAVSEGVRRELVEVWGIAERAVTVCPNAIALPPEEDCHGLIHEDGVVGFFGRLDWCKGVDLLLEALSILKRKGRRFRLVVGGDGPEAADLKSLAARRGLQENVCWLGWVADKKSFFSKIDFLTMPSREEGLPVALLEAMAYARAVIVSDCPGMKKTVNDAACGLVVPREDVVALADALECLLTNQIQRSRFAAAGRAMAEIRYSETRLCQDLLAIIGDITK